MAAKVGVICSNCKCNFLKFSSEINKNPNIKNHYCSKECMVLHRATNKALNPNWNGGKITKLCEQCNAEFSVDKSHADRKYCSRTCTYNASVGKFAGINNPNYKGAIKHIICKQCNIEFTTYHKDMKFCSKECLSKSMIKEKIKLICNQCNVEFERHPSYLNTAKNRNHEKVFCCSKCRREYFRKENSPKWISDRSKLKLEDVSFRSSLDMKNWKIDIFKLDNYTCRICSTRSSKGNPITLNAHHIIRIIDDKTLAHDIDNGIALCDCCHKNTYGKEKDFEVIFKAMRRGATWESIKKQL